MPLLSVRHVTRAFQGLVALNDVSIDVEPETIVGIIGPNGAGKTTLFNCITGFYRPTSGALHLHPAGHPHDLTRLAIHKIARLGVARTYQNIRLFAQMSVLENLLVAQHATVNRRLWAGILRSPAFRRSEAAALEQAWFWLRFMGLEAAADQAAGTLPYGQQRRLEVARAMAARPLLLCLDEPAAGLNPQEAEALNDLILRLKAQFAVSILLIEHHMGVVMRISDHVVVLDHGEVIGSGTPAQVRQNPAVVKAYLGEDEPDARAPPPAGGN